jgi:hypothetical protein
MVVIGIIETERIKNGRLVNARSPESITLAGFQF